MRKCLMRKLGVISSLIVFCGALFLGVFLFSYDYYVSKINSKYIFFDIENVPEKKCALVLGTTKYLKDGRENLFFNFRIQAGIELFEAGKISCFVVSGDNSIIKYNEPEAMRQDLIALGVPDEKIYLDYAGFDTYDSVVRMKEIFGQDSFIIVSQKFHNERALHIARKKGFDVVAYNARDVYLPVVLRVLIREKFARVKMFYELLVDASPKFWGERIYIE